MEATRLPLKQHDVEVGYADVMQTHDIKVAAHHAAPPNYLIKWEDSRPRLLVESFAEMLGVFIYCYCGIGATVAFYLTTVAKEAALGSLLTIGFSYSFGIVLAIVIAGPVSGGHLSPCYTIAFWLFRGFPAKKVIPYILSQIMGGFLGTLTVYGVYKPQLDAVAFALNAAQETAVIFSPLGPAGALALYPAIGQNLKYAFANEFVANIFLSVVVFSVLDPSNVFVSYTSAPFIIALAYAAAIWSFGINSLTLNTARDLGARFAVACVFQSGGKGAFPPAYTALACLTNILATPIGAAIQIFLLSDTGRPVVTVPPEGPSLRALTRDGASSLKATSRDAEKQA